MKISYRPEIDGLRAIAVLAVVFYHAVLIFFDKKPFEGGFIGVDIFFVISGYLITSIILKEINSTGSFSFSNFYERRARRILPALFLVILFSIPFAWSFLLPLNFIDFSKSILYSLGFSSNFYFYHTGIQYAAEDSLLVPLLHIWSLSVEEQYYIIFPAVLIVTYKYFKKYLFHILILGFCLSLFLAQWGSSRYPTLNFYMLPTRGWELLAGSILSFLEIKKNFRSQNLKINNILSIFGFLLILHAIFFFNDEMFHPSFYTLSPIIGVSLIIWFTNKKEFLTKILSSRLLVGIGLISYSLYLWHYPIFAFARIKYIYLSTQGKFLLIFLCLFLSVLSYFLVEKNFRNRLKISLRTLSLYLASFLIIITSVTVLIIRADGFNDRFPKILQSQNYKERKYPKNFFEYVSEKNSKKVVLIGDSHMATLSQDLKNKLKNQNLNYIQSIKVGCQFILNLNRVNKKTLREGECNKKFQEKRLELLKNLESSTIILGGRLPPLLEEEMFDNKEGGRVGQMRDFLQYQNNSLETKEQRNKAIGFEYKDTVNKIVSMGHKVILVYPIPEVGWHVPKKIYRNLPRPFKENETKKYLDKLNITTDFDLFKKRTQKSFQLLDTINSENVHRIYPHKLFCNTVIKNRCITHDKKNIFYSDDDHPSKIGAAMINKLLINKIKEIN